VVPVKEGQVVTREYILPAIQGEIERGFLDNSMSEPTERRSITGDFVRAPLGEKAL
jgi:hypothetical protein